MAIDLIYCAGKNKQLSDIALANGFALGCRSDAYVYHDKQIFIDIEYKKPDFEAHLQRVAKERPKYATVPDLSDKDFSLDDIARAVKQAERLKDYCEIVLLVPKLPGHIELLPESYAIAYSIPTSYGGAKYPLWELGNRQVHLLGGSPHDQLEIAKYCNVISADGNMAQKLAIQYCKYWKSGGRNGGQWLKHDDKKQDAFLGAFEKSCQNIYKAWQA